MESSQGIKLKGLLIFAIWMILHTHTHPCMPADNMNPKKALLGPLKGLTSLLWCAKASAKGGACPIAWETVCLPTSLGGLGIRNLHYLNDSLSMKWLWLSRVHADKPWSCADFPCSVKARSIFQASVIMKVGNGNFCLFGKTGGSTTKVWKLWPLFCLTMWRTKL